MSAWVRVCLVVCCLLAPSLAWAREDSVEDEQLLHSASIGTDDRALLDFFRKQTADEAMIQRIRERIEQLGSDSFPERESASKELRNLGPVALTQLRLAIRETVDLEVRHRARECVQLIENRNPPALAVAAARLLARRQPEGTTETLLAFLPGPYDDRVLDEIQTALVEIARVDGRVHAELRHSLASTVPARRTIAALVLCRVDVHVYAASVRKLLDDREASVRFSVARALAYAGDRQTLPVLIDLLAVLPREQAEQVEEVLYRLAGSNAPLVALGVDPAEQRRCREAWLKWWEKFGERIDMAALKDGERQLGYTLLVLLNDNRVVEWDRDGKAPWEIKNLASPLDAEVLPNHRVLIAEYETKRVTERSLTGEILWQKQLTTPPIHAQRLPDGRTFIATRSQLLEVDRSGAGEIVRYRSEREGIITARRYPDGRIACIEKGSYFELSVTGEELRRFAAPDGAFTTNSLTLLPNGHLLIAAYYGGTVQEFDRSGKVVWKVKLGRPLCAVRLPGGNTLVSTQDMVLVEFDRAGKTIARRDAPGHPCQIRRR
jgi:HEAT repeat protein